MNKGNVIAKRLCLIIVCLGMFLCIQQVTEASQSTAEASQSTDEGAIIHLAVDGNRVYVDTEGTWSTIQGSITFDPSFQVKDHGVSENLKKAVSQQKKIGFPVENLMEDEYAFVGVYTSITGEGLEYTGHTFYLTFEDISTPITVTLKDAGENVLETAVLDGTTLPPEESNAYESDQDQDGQQAEHVNGLFEKNFLGSTNLLNRILVLLGIAVVIVVIVLIVIFINNGHGRKSNK